MRTVFFITLTIFLTASCHSQIHQTNEPIVGERIKGDIMILDSINGKDIFTLKDNTLVSCTPVENGWCEVGLEIKISDYEKKTETLHKGRKILLSEIFYKGQIDTNSNNVIVGEVSNDFKLDCITVATGCLVGYISIDKIKNESVIENYLLNYMSKKENNRNLNSLMPLINSFKLEKDGWVKPFITYSNTETWIHNAPGLLFRIQLVFEGNKLIGVVHSRYLQIPGTKDYSLKSDFTGSFYEDVKPEVIKSFIKKFNEIINSVDAIE